MNESALNTYHRGDQWIKACGFNEADIIRRLLDEGADVEQEASNPLYRGNFSPLLQACRHGRLDTARLLLDRGAAVDRVMYGGTPLMIACGAANNTASEHNIDVVRLLLDRGADVNHSVAGGTPLLSALGWPDAVRLLLDRGARVDYGSLVLHAVSMRGRLNNDDAETLKNFSSSTTRYSSASTPSARHRRARARTDGSSRRERTRRASRPSCRPHPRAWPWRPFRPSQIGVGLAGTYWATVAGGSWSRSTSKMGNSCVSSYRAPPPRGPRRRPWAGRSD